MMGGLEDALREAARVAILSLKEEEFVGTADVGGVAWDVYVHPMPPGALARLRSRTGEPFEDAITLAVRLESGRAVCGLFLPGRLTAAQAAAELHEAKA